MQDYYQYIELDLGKISAELRAEQISGIRCGFDQILIFFEDGKCLLFKGNQEKTEIRFLNEELGMRIDGGDVGFESQMLICSP